MKVIILAGGLGTRLSEETSVKPKPMVEIGGIPILMHIMQIYSHYGFDDFYVALGYKGAYIKDYFLNFHNRNSDLQIDLESGSVQNQKKAPFNWKVNLIDTGMDSMTGGRLLRLKKHLKNEPFMLTYGDGVANIDVKKLVEFHKSHGRIGTVSAVRPSARFGAIKFDGDHVVSFREKKQTDEGWINGGFFVFNPEIFDFLTDDKTVLEEHPLETLAKKGQLMSYKHHDYWQCMDTLRDKRMLENLWSEKKAPWKVWK
ncbi:glucose-1-phosphate cytidylyltransferase [bacterium]|jgi:glucose-1-phosphate cytidylyltransferase|nr:glucose-1-phosphate cytidylyltransferase [bacterium]